MKALYRNFIANYYKANQKDAQKGVKLLKDLQPHECFEILETLEEDATENDLKINNLDHLEILKYIKTRKMEVFSNYRLNYDLALKFSKLLDEIIKNNNDVINFYLDCFYFNN